MTLEINITFLFNRTNTTIINHYRNDYFGTLNNEANAPKHSNIFSRIRSFFNKNIKKDSFEINKNVRNARNAHTISLYNHQHGYG